MITTLTAKSTIPVETTPANIQLVPTPGFEAFFHVNHTRLFRALCLITRDPHEAEEIAQESFLVVWERWERIAKLDSPDGYLYRTAMNSFRKRLRKTKRAERQGERHAPTSTDGGIDQIDAHDAAMRALEPLSRAERAAVVLTDLLGLPADEAAQYLGTSPGAVRTAASRGRAELRRLQEGTPS